MVNNKRTQSVRGRNDLNNIDYENNQFDSIEDLYNPQEGSKGGKAVHNNVDDDFINDEDVINNNSDYREKSDKTSKRSYRK